MHLQANKKNPFNDVSWKISFIVTSKKKLLIYTVCRQGLLDRGISSCGVMSAGTGDDGFVLKLGKADCSHKIWVLGL